MPVIESAPSVAAVVRELARDHLAAHRLSAVGVVLPGELPGGLDGLATAGHEEEAIDVRGSEPGELLGERDRGRMRVRPVRVERQLAHLLGGDLSELLSVRVADLHGEEAREHVEVAPVEGVVEVTALAPHDHGHVAVGVAAHGREMQPEVLFRLALKRLVHARLDRHPDSSVVVRSLLARHAISGTRVHSRRRSRRDQRPTPGASMAVEPGPARRPRD